MAPKTSITKGLYYGTTTATTLHFPDSWNNKVYGMTQPIFSTCAILRKRVYPRATKGCKSRVIFRYLRRKSAGRIRTSNYIYNFKDGGSDGSIILVNKSTQNNFLPDGFTREPFGYQIKGILFARQTHRIANETCCGRGPIVCEHFDQLLPELPMQETRA